AATVSTTLSKSPSPTPSSSTLRFGVRIIVAPSLRPTVWAGRAAAKQWSAFFRFQRAAHRHARAAARRAAEVDLLVAGAQGRLGGAGAGFVGKYAEHRRAAARHLGGQRAVLPQDGADGRGLFRAGTMFQRVAGRSAYRRQVAGAHGLFL